MNNLNFGQALEAMKAGKTVSRKEGQRVYLQKNDKVSWIEAQTCEDDVMMASGYVPTNDDMMANDWKIIEDVAVAGI